MEEFLSYVSVSSARAPVSYSFFLMPLPRLSSSKRWLLSSETPWVTPFRVLMLMSCVFFLVYLDRGTMASNGVNGKQDEVETSPAPHNGTERTVEGSGFQGEFDLSNFEDGLLPSMFMVGMAVAIPICSEAVYRVNAFRILALSLGVWSVATICCGFSQGFYSLALCRVFVGVGEAAVISLAPPYIDDHAPAEQKTLWLSCLFVAVPFGYASGFGYGGLVGGNLGWRAAFIIEGIAMIPFILFCLFAQPLKLNMKTATGEEERIGGEKKAAAFWRHTREIFSHPVYGYTLVGYVFYVGFIGVVSYWGAKALKSIYNFDDLLTGGLSAVVGIAGSLLGGLFLDKWGSTISRALHMSAVCCFVPGIVAFFGFFFRPDLGGFLVLFVVALLLLFSIQGPIQAAVLWCVPPNHRTLANGLSVVIIHLFGDVPAPPIFGAVLDKFKSEMEEDVAYGRAMCITALYLIAAGVCFVKSAWIGRTARDYRPQTDAPTEASESLLPSVDDAHQAPRIPSTPA